MSSYEDFLELVDEFASSHVPATGNLYRDRLRVFADWCEAEGHNPLAPTPPVLNAFGRHALQRWKPSTAAQATSALRGVFDYAVATEAIDTSPARHPAVKLPVSRPRAVAPASLPLDEARALMAAAPTLKNEALGERSTIVVAAMLVGGLSPGELMAAKVGHLTSQADGSAVLAVPSRKSFDYVPVHSPWLDAVNRHVAGRPADEALVVNLHGNATNVSNLRSWIANVAAQAGIDRHIPPSLVRDTGAVLLLANGGTAADLVRFLGSPERSDLTRYYAAAGVQPDSDHPAAIMASLVRQSRYPMLDQAERVLGHRDTHPAFAVGVTGAVVEQRLRVLCRSETALPTGKQKDWTIGKLMGAYEAKKKFSGDQRTALQRIANARNDAAHGYFDRVEGRGYAQELIDLARRFLAATEPQPKPGRRRA